MLVEISQLLLADFVQDNKIPHIASVESPALAYWIIRRCSADPEPPRGGELEQRVRSRTVGESNRVSSNSSVESEMNSYDANQALFELLTAVLLDKTEVAVTQRTGSTSIIEIRIPELENVPTMPATGQRTEVVRPLSQFLRLRSASAGILWTAPFGSRESSAT